MHKIIYKSKKYIFPLVIATVATSLSGCNFISSLSMNGNSTPSISTDGKLPIYKPLRAESDSEASVVPTTSTSSQVKADKASANTTKTVNVTLYTSDNQCQALIPQTVAVPAKTSLVNAIGKILETQDTADFSLSGYRISTNKGIATVDFRILPKQKRQLASLSSCEQFALFGSLRKTLTSNSQWQIKSVRFTLRGQEIIF